MGRPSNRSPSRHRKRRLFPFIGEHGVSLVMCVVLKCDSRGTRVSSKRRAFVCKEVFDQMKSHNAVNEVPID